MKVFLSLEFEQPRITSKVSEPVIFAHDAMLFILSMKVKSFSLITSIYIIFHHLFDEKIWFEG